MAKGISKKPLAVENFGKTSPSNAAAIPYPGSV